MKTSTVKPAAAQWYLVDAKNQTLGRLATRIATVLNGKHKVAWSPHQVHSDHIIVINAQSIVLTGKKSQQKEYVRHSGFLGHMKRTPFARLLEKSPATIIEHAVRGMLPRNRLRPEMMKHLHVFRGATHPHEAQTPQPLDEAFSSSPQSLSLNP